MLLAGGDGQEPPGDNHRLQRLAGWFLGEIQADLGPVLFDLARAVIMHLCDDVRFPGQEVTDLLTGCPQDLRRDAWSPAADIAVGKEAWEHPHGVARPKILFLGTTWTAFFLLLQFAAPLLH